ncbi:MAG: sulfite exporter TauE/SafE family protein, partial [Chthoniobacteraceae bacterium]
MTLYEILGLGAVAALAGAINAIAGGGTLLTFPTLIFFGTRPEAANATSTLALVVGTAGSMFGYREHMPAIKNWLAQFSVVSLLGGLIGAVLLTKTSDAAFAHLVPFLVLFATILFVTQDAFRKMGRTNAEESKKRATRSAMAFQFAVAIYGGYFGAGIGILMLASLGFLGFTHIHEM